MNIAVIRNKTYDVSIVDLLSVQFEQHTYAEKISIFFEVYFNSKMGIYAVDI